MKTYRIAVDETVTTYYDVEAKSEKEAIGLVLEGEGEYTGESDYHTMERPRVIDKSE